MSDQLDHERKSVLQVMAHDYLLRVALVRLMLLDPGFAQDARPWLDSLFGQFSASEHAVKAKPEALSAIRGEYMRLLERAEDFARMATSVPRQKSIRRRIFEWFERG